MGGELLINCGSKALNNFSFLFFGLDNCLNKKKIQEPIFDHGLRKGIKNSDEIPYRTPFRMGGELLINCGSKALNNFSFLFFGLDNVTIIDDNTYLMPSVMLI